MYIFNDIKYLFSGLLIGGAIVIMIYLLNLITIRLSRQFSNSYLLKVRNILLSFQDNILVVLSGEFLPMFVTSVISGALLIPLYICLIPTLYSWIPYVLNGIGIIIGICIAVSICSIFKEYRDN